MSVEQGFDMAKTPERQEKTTVTFLGRLKDFGLGNPEGIPSKLADASAEELELYGERLIAASKPVTDFEHDGCIDGRHTNCNCDGSSPEVRERHISGTASDVEIAMNAEASILDTLPEGATLSETIEVVSDHIETATGKKRAAHTGGCGGANGAIVHNELIGHEAAPLAATEVFMNLPNVQEKTGVGYDAALGERVRLQATNTAQWLRDQGWEGQTYVDGVIASNPRGVEDLQTADDAFHGHAEDALVFDLRDNEVVALDDTFVVSLSAVIKKAKGLSGQRGDEGYTQALIADIAKHMAVGKVLPSDETPVFLVG